MIKENGITVKYGEIAPEAKENFNLSTDDKTDFTDLSQLKENKTVPNWGNPCEYGSVLLDSMSAVMPRNPGTSFMGYWSDSVSGSDKAFPDGIVVTFQSSEKFSSSGISFTFDEYNDIFCSCLTIAWYAEGSIITAEEFQPDKARYFCEKSVEAFDKLVIAFKTLNMPENRLKIHAVDFGFGNIYFYGDELKSVKIVQDINPISSEISVNTVDFTLKSKTGRVYDFTELQTIDVYFNGVLRQHGYISAAKRTGADTWNVTAQDYIGMLDGIPFMGGMYDNKNAVSLLSGILSQAKVPFEISEDFKSEVVSGYIPICSCREAVMQICFAIGAVCDTSNSASLKIFKLPDTVGAVIDLGHISQNPSFTDSAKVTEVQLTCHNYTRIGDTVEAYKATDKGSGEGIMTEFSEPLHTLSITDGKIVQSGVNYAVINAGPECVLTGRRYRDNKTVKSRRRTDIPSGIADNVKTISDATLISGRNADKILDLCFNYLTISRKANMKIYEKRHYIRYGSCYFGVPVYMQTEAEGAVSCGDIIEAETEYLGDITGRVISERYNLNGGIIVKECEVV